jgi:hypothetical protein
MGGFAKLDWKHLSAEIAFLCKISCIAVVTISEESRSLQSCKGMLLRIRARQWSCGDHLELALYLTTANFFVLELRSDREILTVAFDRPRHAAATALVNREIRSRLLENDSGGDLI